jgi:hypothetical protein
MEWMFLQISPHRKGHLVSKEWAYTEIFYFVPLTAHIQGCVCVCLPPIGPTLSLTSDTPDELNVRCMYCTNF